MRKDQQVPELKFVPPEEWDTLPVQPPAGVWFRRVRPLVVSFIVTTAIMVIVAFVLAPQHVIAWLVWIPFAALAAQGVACVAMALLALRPYAAERRLGYTTWPTPRSPQKG